MQNISTEMLTVERADPSCYGAAVWMVFGGKVRRAMAGRLAAILQAERQGRVSFEGLFVARRGERIVGAAWGTEQPGRFGTMWPARVIPSESPAVARLLMQSAAKFVAGLDISIAQSLIALDASGDQRLLEASGFQAITNLEYLFVQSAQMRDDFVQPKLKGVPFHQTTDAAAELIATYPGTLDCPEFEGLRPIDDVIAGYCDTGAFELSLWQRLELDGEPAGVMILAPTPDYQAMEIVYLGLRPEMRNRGLGKAAVQMAMAEAKRRGIERLLLAVDQRNEPAIRSYSACGFLGYESRKLMVLRAENPASKRSETEATP
ncbi:GNAT family N-acetyltransferase [Blastopirellula retiformator]|uniref:Putative acetyltransferase n=1 Tax=Blastopirellula retiformator TaxID=2527970 RepID=A0A5C5V1L9_9BACT|nr:GNAT family N-acetyltransferase [Blastopirellula retiformator]TWT31585.1 putative acetyltransferase [Blastopirellula retiformator]